MTGSGRPDGGPRTRGGVVVAAVVLVAMATVTVVALTGPAGRATATSTTCATRPLTAAPAPAPATPTTTSPPFRDNDVGASRIPDTYADADLDNGFRTRTCRH